MGKQIQPGGCITHFDEYDNVAMLVQGSKVFYITEHKNIVERPGGDNEQPDVSPYDGIDRNWFRAELSAGDVLYLPSGWWHYVESKSHTVMTNYWKYRDGQQTMDTSPAGASISST